MRYKYYFKKPKSEIVKDILSWLAIGTAVSIAVTSPYFGINLMRQFPRWRKYKKRKVHDTFKRLRIKGCITIERKNHQIYISLTEEGKKMAGWLQINSLSIKRPKKWDRNWRIVIFDIAQLKRIYRDALRSKLKELGFYPLQKSVWAHPFDCRDEIKLLKEFFGLKDIEMRLIIARDIGQDAWLKKEFKI